MSRRKIHHESPPPDNVIRPAAFAGKPVVVNPKGQGARKGRVRFCKDLSQHRRWHLDLQRRQRDEEAREARRQEEAAQRLANAPNTIELLTLFREILPLLDQSGRAHFGDLFKIFRDRPRPSTGSTAA